jgi:hypothetical protein
MARPKDDKGVPLKAAHFRLNPVPFHEAGLYAMDKDPRTPCLSMRRKLQIIDRAIDHVMDGDKPPAWIWSADMADRQGATFLPDVWKAAVRACERVKREGKWR